MLLRAQTTAFQLYFIYYCPVRHRSVSLQTLNVNVASTTYRTEARRPSSTVQCCCCCCCCCGCGCCLQRRYCCCCWVELQLPGCCCRCHGNRDKCRWEAPVPSVVVSWVRLHSQAARTNSTQQWRHSPALSIILPCRHRRREAGTKLSITTATRVHSKPWLAGCVGCRVTVSNTPK